MIHTNTAPVIVSGIGSDTRTDVIVSTPGISLRKSGKRLIVKNEQAVVYEQLFDTIGQITVMTPGVSLSSDIVRSCQEFRISIVFSDKMGRIYATVQNPLNRMKDLSLLQGRLYESDKAYTLAKSIVMGKGHNQISVVRFYNRHRSKTNDRFSLLAENMAEKIRNEMLELEKTVFKPPFSEARNGLFIAEARMSSFYWEVIKSLCPPELGFHHREKKGAADTVNVMLNYGYGMLYPRMNNALQAVGLNPTISFLHAPQSNKPTLSFDLIEEFRQLLVDKPIFSMLTKTKNYGAFGIDPQSGYLNDVSRNAVENAVLKALSNPVKREMKKMPTEQIILRQAKCLASWVEGQLEMYRPFSMGY